MDVELTSDLEKIKSQYHKITKGYETGEKDISLSNMLSIRFLYLFTHPIKYIEEVSKRFSGS
jgi:hypothetical protein